MVELDYYSGGVSLDSDQSRMPTHSPSVNRFLGDIEKDAAIKELKKMADLIQETVTVKILRVRPKEGSDLARIRRLLDSIREDYADVQVEYG